MNILELINETFVIENEVSAPILITLLVFITGGIIKFIYNTIISWRQRKDLREIFRTMIKEIKNDCKIKENQTEKFYQTLNSDHRGNWSLSYTRINYLHTVSELNFNEVIQAFESYITWKYCNKKLKRKAFHKIYSNLDNIRYFEDFIKPDLQEFITDYTSYHMKYKNALTKYNEMVDSIRFDLQSALPLIKGRSAIDDYAIEMELIWREWLKLDEKERVHFKVTYEMLIEPTLALNRNYNLKFTLEMNKYLMECKVNYLEMISILERGFRTFKNHNFNYRSTRRILDKSISILG